MRKLIAFPKTATNFLKAAIARSQNKNTHAAHAAVNPAFGTDSNIQQAMRPDTATPLIHQFGGCNGNIAILGRKGVEIAGGNITWNHNVVFNSPIFQRTAGASLPVPREEVRSIASPKMSENDSLRTPDCW